MDKYIIESIEGRITLGITMFVAIMILTGWIAINEPARMAEFVEQHEGRSIERGAETFAANCSTCHGINGLGIGGRAPALNNPQLFGYDFLGDLNGEIARYQRQFVEINGVNGLNFEPYNIPDQAGTLALLQTRETELEQQIIAASEAGDAELERELIVDLLNVQAQLNEDTEEVAERIAAIEAGEPIGEDANPEINLSSSELESRLIALQENIPTTLAEIDAALNGEEGLLAQRDAMIEEMSDPIRRGYWPRLDEVLADAEEAEAGGYTLWLTDYLIADANRLTQLSYGGSLDSYIITTLIHGRPGSNTVWPEPMVSWSQRGGGPLRDDQIEDVLSYINNWDKGDGWTIDDLYAVAQFGIIHAPYTGDDVSDVETVAVNVDASTLPEGDVTRGEALYNGAEETGTGAIVGCSGCHMNGIIGPDTVGTWTRVVNERLTEEQFADYTGEQYLSESILAPNAYVVASYAEGVMVQTYSNDLTEQDLADLIAYIKTQDQ